MLTRPRRVVVTGLGMVTPLGETTDESWQGARDGRCGIASVPEWKDIGVPATIAGLVPAFDHSRWLPTLKDIKRGDRFIHLALAAAHQAWLDAGLPDRLEGEASERAGAIVGVGFGGIERLLAEKNTMDARGPSRVSAYSIPAIVANMAAANVAIRYGLRGPSFATSAACASGAIGIGEALMLLRHERCDVVLAGGAEAPVTPLTAAAFASAGALSVSRNDDPACASRPFDRTRDGFVLGEGAGMMVLEALTHAEARGARAYAELVGYGSTCDAWHPTNAPPDGEGATRAMREALAMARLDPADVDYVNAHGTATQTNDRVETLAIKRVFGERAKAGLVVSSTKSMMGHLLGAAGAVEAVLTTLAIRDGVVPPTINCVEPDPDCDLDYVPGVARRTPLRAAISNCFGFGGANAVLALKRLD